MEPRGSASLEIEPGARSGDRSGIGPGLVVLLSGAKAGPGENLAGLFDIVGVTDREADKTQLWTTWQAAKPNFGTGASTAYVAVIGDRDGDGVLNDAADTVADAHADGDVDEKDLEAAGAATIKAVTSRSTARADRSPVGGGTRAPRTRGVRRPLVVARARPLRHLSAALG